MARPEKEAVVKEVAEIFENAKGVFIADFQGLDVEKISDLRRKCREASVSFRVIKNTLARLAAKQVNHEEMVSYLQGPSAIAFSYDDPSAPARVISEFAKKEEKPTIKMSLFEGEFYGPEKVAKIAALPSKDVLLSKIAGGLNAPMQGFASALNGLLLKLVYSVNEIKNVKEKESS